MATTELGGIQEDPTENDDIHDDPDDGKHSGPRQVYFNIPLPATALDENGHPIAHFRRNKIRTSKYTPLTFIPKDLFYQFHNSE